MTEQRVKRLIHIRTTAGKERYVYELEIPMDLLYTQRSYEPRWYQCDDHPKGSRPAVDAAGYPMIGFPFKLEGVGFFQTLKDIRRLYDYNMRDPIISWEELEA